MPHPKDGDQHPIGSRVLWLKKNKKATIVDHGFVKDGKGFLNYYVKVDDMPGNYAAYHDDLYLISAPKGFTRRKPVTCPMCGEDFYGIKCFNCGFLNLSRY